MIIVYTNQGKETREPLAVPLGNIISIAPLPDNRSWLTLNNINLTSYVCDESFTELVYRCNALRRFMNGGDGTWQL